MACESPRPILAQRGWKISQNVDLSTYSGKLSFEVPSNIVLKMVRPSLWISVLLFAWGLVMTLMGVVNSYEGLLATRFFLGVAEAGFFPAST